MTPLKKVCEITCFPYMYMAIRLMYEPLPRIKGREGGGREGGGERGRERNRNNGGKRGIDPTFHGCGSRLRAIKRPQPIN